MKKEIELYINTLDGNNIRTEVDKYEANRILGKIQNKDSIKEEYITLYSGPFKYLVRKDYIVSLIIVEE